MRTNGPIFNFKKNLGGTTMDFTIFILNRKNIIILYKISFLEDWSMEGRKIVEIIVYIKN